MTAKSEDNISSFVSALTLEVAVFADNASATNEQITAVLDTAKPLNISAPS